MSTTKRPLLSPREQYEANARLGLIVRQNVGLLMHVLHKAQAFGGGDIYIENLKRFVDRITPLLSDEQEGGK